MMSSHALVIVLLVAVPLWDIWDARRLRRLGATQSRESSYLAIVAVLWALAFWVLYLSPLAVLVAAPQALLSPIVAAALTAAVLAAMLAPVVAGAAHAPTREKVVAATASVAYMLPRSNREMVLFAAVSITAGICEELIFRAFLPRYFMAEPFGFSMLPAVAVSALMFALAHAGQGWRGMIVAAAGALFFSGAYYATGTLLVPIVLHVVLDLRAIAFAAFARQNLPGSEASETAV
ncbi:MAG: CPBP family intramembrane glutamic endopeptidase [Brevundimonas sp.]|uniref:CPBP family intramembrane glutamic endopeptidase n=1 Tax=Brevundimonas sp. TaxID=1871086 RepID=UPI00391C5706